jgi:hypothetical protein
MNMSVELHKKGREKERKPALVMNIKSLSIKTDWLTVTMQLNM